MEILSFETLPSTQTYLIEQLQNDKLHTPIAIIASKQSSGIGSRDNTWSGGEGNFFASIAVSQNSLPDDLPVSSASIYFAFLIKVVINRLGHEVWLKWPNDLYLRNAKIGGVITRNLNDTIVVGIGINLKKNQNGYSSLDTDISPLILLNMFLEELHVMPNWKQVFSKYKIEFGKSKLYFTHENNNKIDMKNAILCDDGSLQIDGRKVYSLR